MMILFYRAEDVHYTECAFFQYLSAFLDIVVFSRTRYNHTQITCGCFVSPSRSVMKDRKTV